MDNRRDNRTRTEKNQDASSAQDTPVAFILLTPHQLKELKESILNLVSAALIQQPKASVNDPTIMKITRLVKQVSFYDPEFALKLALYVRVDLNIRSTANYLVAVACNITECQPYVKKYFSASVRLPSDWLDVAATYHTLPDKNLKGKSLPTCLRKALVAKFPEFDAYQLGKYNKERSIKRKLKKIKEEQAKGNKKARAPEKPMVTLKQLIRQLHISQPHLQVMCLIGKKYPATDAEFRVSGLYGQYEPDRAGRRMKLPTPETWETLLSEKGNRASTWEELIEHKKLPFMAMIRNLRNMIYTGVQPKYHRWVQNKLSNQQTVAQSKQFPFQFFSAYEVIPKNMEEFKKIMAGDGEDKKAKKGAEKPKPGAAPGAPGAPGAEKRRKKKTITPTVMPTDKLFEDYRKAIDQAVKHATTFNVNPIRGSTVVFCNVSSETRSSSPGAKGMGSSVRSVQEIGYLLGLMCKYVCEDCDFRVWSSPAASTPNGPNNLPVTLKEGSILDNMAAVALVASQLGEKPGEFPFEYLEAMIRDKRRVDNFLVLSHHVINPSDGGANSRLANLLNKYRQEVNHDLLFVSVDLSGSGRSAIGQDEKHPNDIQITGFSDQILRFIAERGDTNQLQYVEHIDDAKKLSKKRDETVDLSPWWRWLDTIGTDKDLVFPNITTGPKWREARVFISSTFLDMHGERDILTRVVLPEVKERAKQRRVNIHEVDLRWGVTEEESQSGKSMQLCLDEVERCRPFFIGILGERYGWAPENYEVPDHPRFHWVKDYPRGRSITELEMHLAALSNPADATGSFFYMRDNLFMHEVPDQFKKFFHAGPEGAEQKMEDLKARIKSSGVSYYEHYPCSFGGLSEDGHPSVSGLDFFGERVFHDLWGAVSNHFPPEAAPTDPLELERSFHQAFVHETTRNFVGRKEMMTSMTRFVQGFHNQLLVLVGKPGDGKSSLMANFAAKYASENQRTFVLSHFIGASPGSTDVQNTLQRLCLELKTVFNLDDEIPTEFKELVNLFPNLLEQASFKGKLVIVLDAVNQLDHRIHRAHALEWLPKKLPCKVIISTTLGKCHENLTHRYQGCYQEMPMIAMDVGDRTQLVRTTLWQYHKKLDERPMNNQMKELLKKADAGNPLYLMVACEELRVFGLYEQISERIKRMSPQIPRLLEEVLKRLEGDHGQEVIQNICSLIVTSRGGLLEHELISMVPVEGFKWAALMRSLSPFLKPSGDSGEISFFHDSFKEATRKRYFLIKKSESRVHGILADYFMNVADPHLDGSWLGGGDKHSVSELPFHLTQAERWTELEKVICDLNFIELKAMHGMVVGLVSDFSAATADGLKYDGLNKVKEFAVYLKASGHVLKSNPALTFQQAANQPSHAAPCIKANALWENLQENRSWVSWKNKPKENDPCKMTFSGHSEAVSACDFSKTTVPLIACATKDCSIHIYSSDSGSLIATLVGHSSFIPVVKFSHDGLLLVSASWDESIIIWDIATELPVATITSHSRKVNDIAFSHDGRYLASASWDTTLKIFDSVADWKNIRTISTGERPVNAVAWAADGRSILAGTWDGLIKVFSLEVDHEGELVATMGGHEKSVQTIATAPGGKHLISGSLDQKVMLWDAVAKKYISTLSVHSKPISSVNYTDDGRYLLSASVDATVKVWDANLGRELKKWGVQNGFMNCVAYNPSNDLVIATGSSECIVSVWDVSTNTELFTFDAHRRPITCLEFSPDGKFLATASEDGTLIVWDAETGKEFYNLKGPTVSVTGVSWSPNGQLLAASSDDFAIRVYDFSTGQEVAFSPFRGHDSAVRSVCFAPNSNAFVSSSRDNSLRTWDLRTGKQTAVYRGHTDWITSVAYSSTGKRMVSCAWDNTIRLWNPRKTSPIAVLEGHDGAVVSVRFSPDGAFVASCSYDGTIKIWDSKSATEITTLKGHKASVNGISFNKQGDKIASVSDDATIRVWNPLTATEISTLIGHSDSVLSAVFSRDNQIATTSGDKTMKIWDIGIEPKEDDSNSYSQPQESETVVVEEIRGHNAAINHLSLSPNGALLLTASDDKTGAIWDIERNLRVRTLTLESNATFKGCEWSTDSRNFLTASDDGNVSVWDTRTGKLERRAAIHNGPATSVALGSNGFTVVSGGWDNLVQTSDLRKVVAPTQGRGHTDWILSVASAPNAGTAISAGWDSTIRVWTNQQSPTILTGHTNTVTSVAVSPDARLIASASYDSTVKIWNLVGGNVERTLAGHVGNVNKVVFTPKTQNLLLSAGSDHIIKLWDVPTGQLQNEFVCSSPATAIDAVTRNGELLMVYGDYIGNLYVTKLNSGRF